MTGNPIADQWRRPVWVDPPELPQGPLTTRTRWHPAFRAGRRIFVHRPSRRPGILDRAGY
jgi:hypothetical protein